MLPKHVEAVLQDIVGVQHVGPAGDAHAIRGVQSGLVVEPADERQVAAVLACASEASMAVVPRGGGTKLTWGNPPTGGGVVLSMARLDRVIEHAWADMTVTVEAGCTVGRLQAALAEHGQRLALDALWPERATVGGVLSTNDSGALRLRYGGLRDLVIGITLALPDGALARSGGKVVKNVAGYDLPKLVTGALGTLGVITQATFRLHPLPRHARTLSFPVADATKAGRLVGAIQDAQLAHAALQIRAGSGSRPVVDVLFEGPEAGISGQEETVRALASTAPTQEPDPWRAREELWLHEGPVAKISVPPADLAWTLDLLDQVAGSQGLRWRGVLYAHGLGSVRLDGELGATRASLADLREALAGQGGTLVAHRQPPSDPPIDAWGEVGDALPLMRAVKQQFDPRGILNPGRFVGGI